MGVKQSIVCNVALRGTIDELPLLQASKRRSDCVVGPVLGLRIVTQIEF